MKTDRELLELAAKAAGFTPTGEMWLGGLVCVWTPECGVPNGAHRMTETEDGKVKLWSSFVFNPLRDDGAALRLAVKLNIEFACFDDKQAVNAGVWSTGPESWDCMTPYNGDKQAAVRRAITRAATEIQLARERA